MAAAVLALHHGSLFLLLFYSEVRLNLLLFLQVLVQALFRFLQLVFQLLLFWRPSLRLAELLEVALDFLILIVY